MVDRLSDLTSSGAQPVGNYHIKLIGGSANPRLSESIAAQLGTTLEPAEITRFADGEINIHIKNNVRGTDVFVIQPTSPDVNSNLMELLLLIHTLKLSSASRIIAVVPYFGYARQDRKTKPRVPISASAVAQLLEKMGPHRIITVDLHCSQIQGFFHDTPMDNLFAEMEFVRHLEAKNFVKSELVIVSPDAGGVERARRVADRLHALAVVTIIKRRAAANVIEEMQVVGDVTNKVCIIVDDMIDTAGTLTKAADLLKQLGATRIVACATHGLFSGPALERINNSVLEEVIVTDSIPQEKNQEQCPKLAVLTLVTLLAEAILRSHQERSLSALFEVPN